MARQFYSPRDLRFHLYEVLDAERLTRFPYFADHDRIGTRSMTDLWLEWEGLRGIG